MAGRIRSIKPEINENKRTAALSSDAWRLFVGLWLEADDYGNLYADPARLMAAIFWAVAKKPKMDEILGELTADPPLIQLYEHKGQCYAHINGWDHQKIDHPGLPRVPGPDPEETERIRAQIQEANRERSARRSRKPREVLASTDRAFPETPESISGGARPRSGPDMGVSVLDPDLGSTPSPDQPPAVATTRAPARSPDSGPRPERVPAYPALARFAGAAGPVLLLGDLVPCYPAPEGLGGRLPASLEAAWLGTLARFQDEAQLTAEQVLERLDKAGAYLKAGGFGWLAKGAGVALHALLNPRQGLFLRLLAEAGAWDGKAPADKPQKAHDADAAPVMTEEEKAKRERQRKRDEETLAHSMACMRREGAGKPPGPLFGCEGWVDGGS